MVVRPACISVIKFTLVFCYVFFVFDLDHVFTFFTAPDIITILIPYLGCFPLNDIFASKPWLSILSLSVVPIGSLLSLDVFSREKYSSNAKYTSWASIQFAMPQAFNNGICFLIFSLPLYIFYVNMSNQNIKLTLVFLL